MRVASAPSSPPSATRPPTAQPCARPFPPRPGRPKRIDEELPIPPPSGGPLALYRPPERLERTAPSAAPEAASVVDRLIVGRNREGLPEVRMDVAVGALKGTEVHLAAGAGGLEATFVAATESARRIVEAQLADLTRALEGRGLSVARCQVTTRHEREARRQDGERGGGGSWEDSAE